MADGADPTFELPPGGPAVSFDARANVFTIVSGQDATDGWLLPVQDADGWDGQQASPERADPIQLLLKLLRGDELNMEARGLLADFLFGRRFVRKGRRGRPRARDPVPWTPERNNQLAKELLRGENPGNWRVELSIQLGWFRLSARKGNRVPVYMRSVRDAQLLCAAAETRACMRSSGFALERVAEVVAPRHSIELSTLLNYMAGRRGSRRHAK